MFSFFDRLSAGWTAAKACVDVLRRDKKLVIFPLLSGISPHFSHPPFDGGLTASL
jgi:hypothetical protein